MNFNQYLPSATKLRPSLPVGCLFDIPTGKYLFGKEGESILNCGCNLVNGLAGPGNSFKSEILNYLIFRPLGRLAGTESILYDTENSMSYERINSALAHTPGLEHIDALEDNNGKVFFTQSADILGDKWFDRIKELGGERAKNKEKLMLTTPFIDDTGKPIRIIKPLMIAIDSLSDFKISAVQEKVVDENNIGDSGAKIQFVQEGLAKTQLITQLPNLGSQAGIYFYMVAQTGMKIDMGGMFAPKETKMAHSKNGYKSKGVPDKWSFINNNLFEIFNAKPLLLSGKEKRMLYPALQAEKDKPSVDLNIVSLVNVRNKGGASGFKFELIVSQSQGLLPDLTMFHYIKEQGRYGISGNNTTFHLDLYPELSLTRTTLREKLRADARLCRAIEITTQMQQMSVLWPNLDPVLHCTPAELYQRIKAVGYDWNQLLDSRAYWVFEEDKKNNLPYLSTMDLLRMAHPDKLYTPKWYKP